MNTMTFDVAVLGDQAEQQLAQAIEAGVLAGHVLDSGGSLPGVELAELETLRRLGEEAYSLFIQANLRLVTMVANPMAARWALDADDLFQEGVLGLLEALRRFDHTRDARFATFALPWIRMRIGDYALTRAGTVGLPASRAKAWVQVVAIRDALELSRGQRPTLVEVAARAGRSVAQVRALLAYRPPTRVDAADLAAGVEQGEPPPADPLTVQRLLRRLGREERVVLERLYGLDGHRVSTYDEIARQLGVSASTVRRRERTALERLRAEREDLVA